MDNLRDIGCYVNYKVFLAAQTNLYNTTRNKLWPAVDFQVSAKASTRLRYDVYIIIRDVLSNTSGKYIRAAVTESITTGRLQ